MRSREQVARGIGVGELFSSGLLSQQIEVKRRLHFCGGRSANSEVDRLIFAGAEGGGEWAGDAIGRSVQLMGVPGDALAGDFAVLLEIVEGEGVGAGIVLLIGEDRGLFGGLDL